MVAGSCGAILRTAPAAVKHKPEDRFGPLAMLVAPSGSAPPVPPEFRGLVKPALPAKFHPGAEVFRDEAAYSSLERQSRTSRVRGGSRDRRLSSLQRAPRAPGGRACQARHAAAQAPSIRQAKLTLQL